MNREREREKKKKRKDFAGIEEEKGNTARGGIKLLERGGYAGATVPLRCEIQSIVLD